MADGQIFRFSTSDAAQYLVLPDKHHAAHTSGSGAVFFRNDAKRTRLVYFQKGSVGRGCMRFVLFLNDLGQNAEGDLRRGHRADGQSDGRENTGDLRFGESGRAQLLKGDMLPL